MSVVRGIFFLFIALLLLPVYCFYQLGLLISWLGLVVYERFHK